MDDNLVIKNSLDVTMQCHMYNLTEKGRNKNRL